MLRRRLGQASAWVLVAACTVTNDENPFASGTPTSVTVASSASTSSDEETGEGSSESAGSSGDSGGSSSGDDTSSSGATPTSTTMPAESSSGPLDPTDGQPADGMYSSCTTAQDCGNIPILCITNADMTDGYCSETGCANPAADCDPAPGGTASPICVGPISVNGNDEMVCALGCAGLQCPAGMVCMSFTDLGMICM